MLTVSAVPAAEAAAPDSGPSCSDPVSAASAAAPDDNFPGRPVYITNSGDDDNSGPHTIAIYTAGQDGRLTPLGQPVQTGLGARGIVFAPDGRHAFVVAPEEDLICSYPVADNGALVSPGTSVPSGGLGPFGIAMAPDGRTLYTADIGDDETLGTVSAYAVRSDGSLYLRNKPTTTRFQNAKDVAVTPDGQLLFVSHGTPADADPDVLVTFAIRPDGGLDRLSVTAIGASGAGISITPNGQFLYVASQITNNVYGFHIGSGGVLTPVPDSPVDTPNTPEGVTVAPDGRHLYVASVATQPESDPNEDGVWAFTIGADGSLTAGTRTDAEAGAGGPVAVTSTPDGRHLYTSNNADSTVSGFNVDPPSGALQKVADYSSRGLSPAFSSIGVLPNQGPAASFSAQTRPAGQPTTFDATASSDRDGTVARYDWNFGDGTVLPNGGSRPTHIYQYPGTFRATVTVTDNEGCSVDLVFTGHSRLCGGSPAARAARSVTVPR